MLCGLAHFTSQPFICQSPSEGSWTDWYLDPEDENATSIADEDRINSFRNLFLFFPMFFFQLMNYSYGLYIDPSRGMS